MKIEVLCVSGCPSHGPSVRLLKEVLALEGVTAEIREVLVMDETMARDLKFRGSPTIRIDGHDILEDSSAVGALACRLYPGSTQIGVPSADMILRALRRAREEKRQ